MLLYVNGDRLSGGAGAVNDFVSAGDDIQHPASGNTAHPDNLMHSYGFYLSKLLNLGLRCEAVQRKNNQEIYDSVVDFVKHDLPRLRSVHTVVVIGWMPGVEVSMLNRLADKLEQLGIQFVFFNTKRPLLQSTKLTFSNYLDLTDPRLCFLQWCKDHGYNIKNDQYPDANAHNAWAKYIFGRMIEVL